MSNLTVKNEIQEVKDGYSADYFKFSVDWLSVRIDGIKDVQHFVTHFASRFGLSDKIGHIGEDCTFQYRDKGILFYKNAVYVPSVGYGAVCFSYNLDEHGHIVNEKMKVVKGVDSDGVERSRPQGPTPGLFLNISGDGCRWINSLIPDGMRQFVRMIAEYDSYNVTRIDCACDILDPNNRVVPLIQEFATSIVSKCSTIGLSCNMPLKKPGNVRIDTTFDPFSDGFTHNVTVGTRESCKGQMQLYNKYVEMSSGRLSDIAKDFYEGYVPEDYWWRLEYRIKGQANTIFKQLLEDGVIAAFYKSAVLFGRFYDDKYNGSDVNKCVTSISWQEFLSFLKRLSVIHLVEFVSMEYVSPCVSRTKAYAENISVFIAEIVQIALVEPRWFVDLALEGFDKLLTLPKYKPWLDDFKRKYGVDVSDAGYVSRVCDVFYACSTLRLPVFADIDMVQTAMEI